MDTISFLRRQDVILNIKCPGEQIQESSVLCHAKHFTLTAERNCSTVSQIGHLMDKQAARHLLVSHSQADHRISGFCKHTGHISHPKKITQYSVTQTAGSKTAHVYSADAPQTSPTTECILLLKVSPLLLFFPFLFCLVFLLFFPSLLLTSSTTQAYNQQGHHALEHTHSFMLLSHSNKWSLFAGAHG